MKIRTRLRDRSEAGRRLGAALEAYGARRNVLVLALPRGGVPVGYEVARALNAPLDIMLVRKLGVPGHEEMAMGAIASGGIRILSDEVIAAFGISEPVIAAVAGQEEEELDRREKIYRGDRPFPMISGRSVILVDDGLATGSTMRAAALAIKAQEPDWLAVAVPVAPAETCAALRREVDDVVCLLTPSPFFAVGNWYEDFSQISDDEVHQLLERATAMPSTSPWR
jgi:putative phosphoribosyl transferase